MIRLTALALLALSPSPAASFSRTHISPFSFGHGTCVFECSARGRPCGISLQQSGPLATTPQPCHGRHGRSSRSFLLSASDENEETLDNDDDEEMIDPNSLGDWRTFRMNLANSGLSSTTSTTTRDSTVSTSVESIDGINLVDSDVENVQSVPRRSGRTEVSEKTLGESSTDSSVGSRPKSVSKLNEKLLKGQSEALAEEYLNGVWAHESAIPEVGGVLCRMPLEAEIYRGDPKSPLYQKLQQFLNSNEYDRDSDAAPVIQSLTKSSSASMTSSTGGKADSVGGTSSSSDSSLSLMAAKTVFWYRGAEKLLKQEMSKITQSADSNGKIEAGDLKGDSLEILQLYMDHQQSWQEVCLVTEKEEATGTAKTLTINRPMAFSLSKSLARLVLLGAYQGTGENKREQNGRETQVLVKFLTAFENQCAIYVGGPDDMEKPATLIHGIKDLAGSEEIYPGTGIYRGKGDGLEAVEAAVDGVLQGKYKPLDFRFFIGCHEYSGGRLDEEVRLGKYQPVACSRPLVLKQCIQLPKPLWHEVMEFCGGELKEISKLELMKRDDLQHE